MSHPGHFEDGAFFITYRVYYEDTDAAAVVYYANYLRFAERARTDALRHIGIGQRELMEKDKLGFVVREAKVKFLSPAKLDDLLTIETRLHDIGRASLNMRQIIRLGDKTLAEVEVKLAVVDGSFRPVRLPSSLSDAMQARFTLT